MNLFLRSATFSRPTLVLLAIAGLLAALVSNPAATAGQRLSWLGAGVIAQISLTAVYLIGARLGLARWRMGVLATVVLGGAARALTIWVLATGIGTGDPLALQERVLVGTITFTAWGVILGAVVQGWMDYRTTLRELLGRVDRTRSEAEEFTRSWNSRLAGTPLTARSLAEAAADLHDDIQHRLRPLSHRLWFGTTDRQALARFIRAILVEPLPIAWIAVILTVLYTWNTSPHVGVSRSVAVAAISVSGVVVLLLLASFVARRLPRFAVPLRLASLAGSAGVVFLVDRAASGWADGPGILVVALGMVALIIGIQTIAVSIRHRRITLATLGTQVDELESERIDLATDLHSRVQSRWTATALRLQEAAETGDLAAAHLALTSARALLEDAVSPTEISADLATLSKAWEGIAAIRLTVPPELPLDMHSMVARLIEEAIANAVRHGRARTIDVIVTIESTTVDVVVCDDGIGVHEAARSGLGSSWLDGIAAWSLEDSGSGARLTARLPRTPR